MKGKLKLKGYYFMNQIIRNYKKITVAVMASLSLTSCSSGNSGGGNNTPQTVRVQGPISYQEIQQMFTTPIRSNKNSLKSGGGCGSVLGNVSTGLSIATGFISLIPRAGTALGLVTGTAGSVLGYMGSNAGNSCVQQEFANMQLQLNTQAQEIATISVNLQDATTALWGASDLEAIANYNTDYGSYSVSIGNITGSGGFVQEFMQDAGFWYSDSHTLTPAAQSTNVESAILAILSSQGTADYSSLQAVTSSGSASFITSVRQIAGVTVKFNQSQNQVTVWADSQYLTMLEDLQLALAATMTYQGTAINLVPFLSQYNGIVVNTYQQSLYAVQQAYAVAYMINYINYANYTQNPQAASSDYLQDITSVTGAYYNPTNIGAMPGYPNTESGQAAYYNNAQEELTLVFAQIVNQLYLNTLNYIITDVPVGNQSYSSQSFEIYTSSQSSQGQFIFESTNEVIPYLANVGTGVGSATAALYSALQNSPAITGTAGKNLIDSLNQVAQSQTLLYYQYPLPNVVSCVNALEKYSLQNGALGKMQDFYNTESAQTACAPMLTTANGSPVESSVVSGQTIQPYYVNNDYPALMGSVTNNIAACNGQSVGSLPGYNLYIYAPTVSYLYTLGQVGVSYLMCGNWSTDNFPSNGSTNGQLILSGVTGQSVYTLNPLGNFDNSWSYGTNFYYSQNSPQTPNNGGVNTAIGLWTANGGYYPTSNMTNITLLNFNSQNWSSSSSNYNNNNGDIVTQLQSGWMNENHPSVSNGDAVANVAAIQITLPDGFIAPLALTYTNISGWGGNYVAITPNPNALQVYIESSSLYGTDNVYYWTPSSGNTDWAPSFNNNYQYSYSGNGGNFVGSGFSINNNMVLLNGAGFENSPYNGQLMQNANAWIVLNPSSCPTSVPNPAGQWTWVDGLQAYMYYTPQQSYNWICSW